MSSSAASALPASAQHIWQVHKAPSIRGRQGKLDPNRRLKVKTVRERRACLRCSMLRIPCSQDAICVPCGKLVEAALHAHEKRTLSFCGCVRTRLGELNLFEYCIPPPHERGSVQEKTDKLALRSITLSFSSLVTWDLSTIVLELVEWLNNLHLSNTSKVGLLSSPNFLDLVEPHVGAEIGVSFQRMLYAESLAYTQPTSEEKHHLSIPELQQIGGIAGHTILLFLDGRLKPDSLRAC
ncbi:hypothetical protein F5882DRAFT_497775 [Hyaloscypha sp. PMI_1271]|nr:hypothetical protein F5882DRAFT_497775 [Hyaloscypha sp. PMI_1271]